jgi:hypothetical protein
VDAVVASPGWRCLVNTTLTVETPRPVLIACLRLAAVRRPADSDLFTELAKVLETMDEVPPGEMDRWRWSALHQVIVARAYLVLAGEL